MPRRFFRKFAVKRQHVSEKWFMAPFQHLLHDRQLWGIRRRNVVPAFALGVFISFLPIPGHMLVATFVALALRVNIPVAVLATWISNPATVGFMYYFGYKLGLRILRGEEQPFAFEPTLDWLTHTFVTLWQPLLLGCCILAVLASLVAYVVLDLVWRLSIADYKTRKRALRENRMENKED